MTSKPLPRIEDDCLVVPYGAELPRICARSGTREDLVRIIENFACGGLAMLLLTGGTGLLLGRKTACVKFYLHKPIYRRMRKNRTMSALGAVTAAVVLMTQFFLPHVFAFAGAVVVLIASIVAHQTLGRSLIVANIWEGEIFLARLPAEITRAAIEGDVAPRGSS